MQRRPPSSSLFPYTPPFRSPAGRSTSLAGGERRFVLRRWVEREPPRPYQVAEVEEFDDDPVDPAEAAALAADVRTGFARLARALDVLTERAEDEIELAPDPQLLSFQVAAALAPHAAAKPALPGSRRTTLRPRPP